MTEKDERPIVKSTTAARQGVTGHNVRYVLIWGTLLAAVALMSFYFLFLHSRAPG
jgi:hypothetical protein